MAVLASAFNIGDTQAHLNVPLAGVAGGGFNVKIDDELLHVGGVENRTGLVLAMSFPATENHAQGATVTPVLDASTVNTTSPFVTGGEAGETNVYVQPTDPGAVGAGKLWVDTTEGTPFTIQRRGSDDNSWFPALDDYVSPRASFQAIVEGIVRSEAVVGSGVNLVVRDDEDVEVARVRLDEDGIALSGNLDLSIENAPEVPASPTEQDIVDALLALGLVTQAP